MRGCEYSFFLESQGRAVEATLLGSQVVTAVTAKSSPEKLCLDTAITKTFSLSTNPWQIEGENILFSGNKISLSAR